VNLGNRAARIRQPANLLLLLDLSGPQAHDVAFDGVQLVREREIPPDHVRVLHADQRQHDEHHAGCAQSPQEPHGRRPRHATGTVSGSGVSRSGRPDATELPIAPIAQLVGRDRAQRGERGVDGSKDACHNARRVTVRAAERLGDHLVGDSEAQQIVGGQLQSRRGLFGAAGVTPQDRRCASGDATEYTACSSISTRSANASAKAPPDPPSPMTVATIGTPASASS